MFKVLLFAVAIAFGGCNCRSPRDTLNEHVKGPAYCIGGNYACWNQNSQLWCNAEGKQWICDCNGCIVVNNFPVESK